MSKEINNPSLLTPEEGYQWYKVWCRALTKPSVDTFEDLLLDANATPKRPYVWIIGSFVLSLGISLLLQEVFGYGVAALHDYSFGFLFGGTILLAVAGLLAIIVYTSITQWIASRFGGTGTYAELVYAFASFMAPLGIIYFIIVPIPVVECLLLPIGIYQIVLNAIAIKTVNDFSWVKAITTGIIPLIFVLVLYACIVGVMVSTSGG